MKHFIEKTFKLINQIFFMDMKEIARYFPKGYILPAIISSWIFFYTLSNWGIPWRLSFLMGAIGWFAGIMAQTAFFGTE